MHIDTGQILLIGVTLTVLGILVCWGLGAFLFLSGRAPTIEVRRGGDSLPGK
jgi:hypothetical protein